MSTARIGGMSFVVDNSARIGGLSFTGDVVPDNVTGRIGGLSYSGPVANRLQGRIGGVRFDGDPVVALSPVGLSVIEPYTLVTVTVTKTETSPAVVSYNWRQISGTPVVISGSGATRNFEAPAGMGMLEVVFGVSATDANGNTSPEQSIVFDILPHTFFALQGTSWVAVPLFDSIQSAPTPSSGLGSSALGTAPLGS